MRRKILSLLIFVVILCVYPLYAAAEIRNFTHVEQQDSESKPTARVRRARVYDDNTVVLQMIRINATTKAPKAAVVFYNTFSLRIINTNGTVIEKEFDLDIPSFNYNIYILSGGPTKPKGAANFLNYYLIRKNQILVTYFNATDENDYNTYDERGMIIDFDGRKYDEVVFGPAFVDTGNLTSDGITTVNITGNLTWNMNSEVFLNINPEKGFIVLSNLNERTIWQQFRVEPDGKITRLTNGEFNFRTPSLIGTMTSTMDEGYAFIYANITTLNIFDPLATQGQLSMIPIGYNQSTTGSPLILYQTSVRNLTFGAITCNPAFVGIGQTCILTIIQNLNLPQIMTKTFLKVDFLSTGSVIGTEFIGPIPPNITITVYGLQYGGFLLTSQLQMSTVQKGYYGFFIDMSNYFSQWEFPEPIPSNSDGVLILLPNNTLMIAQPENRTGWQFQVIDAPKFIGDKDKGYSNGNVEGTSPQIQDIISPKSPLQISIDFYNPIVLSDGYLSIYLIDDNDQLFLRQKIPANGFSIVNDSSISAKALESTFSISNGEYFIEFDNEFAKDMSYNEPLLGIKDNVWKIKTGGVADNFAPSTTGLLRLTPNGTIMFDNFSREDRRNFFKILKDEISFAVPVDEDRLITNENIQLEKGAKEKQYLVSIGILETRDEYENSVETIIHLIDVMVKNQDQSPIGFGRLAGFLDEDYGFVTLSNLWKNSWEKYRTKLAGLFVFIAIFLVLFFFANKKNSEGNNIAILRIGVILFDLIMDILFVSTISKDVPSFYIPSVVFTILPIAINTALAFYIISEESTKLNFYEWSKKNGIVASLFTVLAGADIEALTILKSKMAGFEFFNAPFSKSADIIIFWGAFLNIFTEDIPQVIIHVYYKRKSVFYEIVPLLILISSSLHLIINIVGRLYEATNHIRKLNENKYNPNNDMDFGGLANIEVVDGKRGIGNDGTTERTMKSDEEFVKADEKTEKPR